MLKQVSLGVREFGPYGLALFDKVTLFLCVCVCVCVCVRERERESLSCIQLFVTLCTLARQTPLSMEFSRQKYWNG